MASTQSSIRISRDRWPLWLWALGLFMAGSLALAIEAAISSRWALIALVLQSFGLLLLSQSTPLEIYCADGLLHVGGAKIEREFISSIEALDSEAMRITRGPKADPAAYLALRFWVATGVKISISDPKDPTPYWLVSTKRAEKLIAVLKN